MNRGALDLCLRTGSTFAKTLQSSPWAKAAGKPRRLTPNSMMTPPEETGLENKVHEQSIKLTKYGTSVEFLIKAGDLNKMELKNEIEKNNNKIDKATNDLKTELKNDAKVNKEELMTCIDKFKSELKNDTKVNKEALMTCIDIFKSELKNDAKDNKVELKNEAKDNKEELIKKIEENSKTPNLNTILIVFVGIVVGVINNFDKLIQVFAFVKK